MKNISLRINALNKNMSIEDEITALEARKAAANARIAKAEAAVAA